MNSGGPKPSNKGGGILRSREGRPSGRGVTFSSKGDANDGGPKSRTPTINVNAANDGGYDSDEAEDAIMASGDAFSIGRKQKRNDNSNIGGDDIDMMDDAAVRTSSEIEEAKRKRGRVRRREDDETTTGGRDFEKDDMDDDDDGHKGGGNDDEPGLSLITDRGADPDAYESNAAENAECPVEPFNMEAEKESGLGYFDGDTYVFRQNDKPVDGEEDAWLDGFGDEEDGGGNKGEKVGGSDSTSIWKPSSSNDAKTKAKEKRKANFVNEDAIPEDLGRRLVTLLQQDDETVMAALTRHGASMRGLQAQEQKMNKKAKLKKRKSSKNKKAEEDSTTAASEIINPEAKQLKMKVEQTRETVEEITELADALLFGGETEAYDLTRRDWIHKFKLEQYFPSSSSSSGQQKKRPPEAADVGEFQAKKKNKGYFDEDKSSDANDGIDGQDADANKPQHSEVIMWEYKGNEDGVIQGPYTSKHMLDWTSCGYFVGESAVDIRRVGSNNGASPGENDKQKNEEDAKADDVDDLMADLMDDDDDKEEPETKKESEKAAESSWMRSDRVDFSLFL